MKTVPTKSDNMKVQKNICMFLACPLLVQVYFYPQNKNDPVMCSKIFNFP